MFQLIRAESRDWQIAGEFVATRGRDAGQVARFAGHARPSMTLDRYTHAEPEKVLAAFCSDRKGKACQ